MSKIGRFLAAALAVCLMAPAVQAAEQIQEWELVNPAGIVKQASLDPAPRLDTLEGKHIVLRWNSKHNGDIVLAHLKMLLAKKYPTAKITLAHEVDPSLGVISGSAEESARITAAIRKMSPDIVIASQCD